MKIRQIITKIAILLSFSSCYYVKDPPIDQKFKERFVGELDLIHKKRAQLKNSRQQTQQSNFFQANRSPFQRPNEIIHKFPTRTPPPQARAISDPRIPPDIFELHYSTTPYPPFNIAGAEFDNIYIPKEDAYGIKSELSHKQYKLAGNDNLQRSLDNFYRSKEDLELSKILIQEQKTALREEKLKKIRRQLTQSKKTVKTPENYEEWAKKKRELRNEPLNKAIRAQIVAQNLYKNRPQQPQNQQNNQR